jgi:hypothetical protein
MSWQPFPFSSLTYAVAMMRAVVAISLAITTMTPAAWGNPSKRLTAEPFDTFRTADKMLALLNTQVKQADVILAKARTGSIATSSGKNGQQPWTRLGQHIYRSASAIRIQTASLRRHYRRSVAGKTLVLPLDRSAVAVKKIALSFASARDPKQAKAMLERLNKALIDLVLAFHSISSNHGALRCERGLWACCQPVESSGSAECKWDCVTRPSQCRRGLIGPRSRAASGGVVRR